jgi:hypothetical protein
VDQEIMHSESENALIFPFYAVNGEMFAYQMRKFEGEAKWITRGPIHSEPIWITPQDGGDGPSETLVLVEDIISAIRVGHSVDAICLAGQVVHHEVTRMFDLYKRVIFWLDDDAFRGAVNQARKFGTTHGEVTFYVLRTAEDPKAYSDREILEHINSVPLETEDVGHSC